jgi:Macrocin-O-methyltransferase (TylF)
MRWGVYCLGRLCLAYFAHKDPPPLVRYFASNLTSREARDRSLELLRALEAERDVAAVEKLEFIRDHMPTARLTASRWDVLEIALRQVSLDGLFAEFGVADGQSLRFICHRVNRPVYGFDSFRGLPEYWKPGVWPGTFARPDGKPPAVPKNAVIVSGYFDQTLPGFVQSLDARPAAFLHLDADLYASTSTVLSALRDRIVPGTVLVFDDYFGYPGWKSGGEFRAFEEFLRVSGYSIEYLACNAAGQQVAAQILPKPEGSTQPIEATGQQVSAGSV